MKRFLIALFSLAVYVGLSAQQRNLTDIHADSMLSSHKIIFFGKGEEPETDSVNNVIRKFYEDQFRHFQEPMAPYFLFMSKDSQLAMGMGGVVRMRGYFDWCGSVPSPGFAPYLIPMTDNPERRRFLGTTPAGTALFFRVLGTNKSLGEYQLYIETNFNGYETRDLRLKKAYAQVNDWTIGYTNSTFSDPTAVPPAVDPSGPNAKIGATDILVRWMHTFKKGFTLAASLESPTDMIQTIPDVTAKVSQFLPDVAMFGQFAWDGSNHIRLAGILRTLPYRDLISAQNRYHIGYGLQATGIWHPCHTVTLYGCFNGGQGYASLGGDFLMGNYDLVADPEHQGRLYAPFCYGGYAAAQYNFTPDIFASATFGAAHYSPSKGSEPSEYKQGIYIAANVFWYLTPRISCGAELDLGRRLNYDGSRRWARRVGAFAQFSF